MVARRFCFVPRAVYVSSLYLLGRDFLRHKTTAASVMASLEARGFKIAVLAGSAVASGVTMTNIIFYARMRKTTCQTPPVSKTQATWMMWINIALFVVSLVLLLWAVWALLFAKETRAKYTKAAVGYLSSGAQSAQNFLASTAPLVPAAPGAAPSNASVVAATPATPAAPGVTLPAGTVAAAAATPLTVRAQPQ
jgi:cbb3-type cytochrome oxidase subunit 3